MTDAAPPALPQGFTKMTDKYKAIEYIIKEYAESASIAFAMRYKVRAVEDWSDDEGWLPSAFYAVEGVDTADKNRVELYNKIGLYENHGFRNSYVASGEETKVESVDEDNLHRTVIEDVELLFEYNLENGVDVADLYALFDELEELNLVGRFIDLIEPV